MTLTQPLISKQCNHCRETKPIEMFSKNRSQKDGYQRRCKPCMNAANTASKAKAGKELNDYRQHKIQLRNKYGITPEIYQEMLDKQKGKCAICGTDSCSTGRRLAVDHCHTTGKVRGLLCAHCNTALGKFNDDPQRIQSAINYLASF